MTAAEPVSGDARGCTRLTTPTSEHSASATSCRGRDDVDDGAPHCSTAEGIVEDSAVLTGDCLCEVDTEMFVVGARVPFDDRGRVSSSRK